jgi:hypothetical protein
MLNEYAQEFLAEIAPVPRSMVRDPSTSTSATSTGTASIRKPTSLRFLNVDRREFDEWLVSLLPANVDVVGSSPVRGFTQDHEGVTVTVRASTAPNTLCAATTSSVPTGRARPSAAPSAKAAYPPTSRCRTSASLRVNLSLTSTASTCATSATATPTPTSCRRASRLVGSVYYPKTKRPHEKQDQTMRILRQPFPSWARRSSGRLPWHSTCARPPTSSRAGRVLLVGEAGGFMSPTSGEGISYAMNSGAAAGGRSPPRLPDDALAAYSSGGRPHRLEHPPQAAWLPFMESAWGKYLAGFVPTPIVSKVTEGL